MARDDAYRIVQRLAQQAWDTQTPLRDAARAEPRLGLDLDAIFDYGHYVRHVPEVLARLEAIPELMTLLLYAAPEQSADLFHAIPAGIVDPFLYTEDGRRPRRHHQRARRRQGRAPRASRCSIRRVLGARRAARRGRRAADDRGRACAARLPRARRRRAAVPAEFPLAVADHLRGGGIESRSTPRRSSPAGALKTRGPARGHPARPAGGRRGDGHGRGADPRAAARAHLARRSARAMQAVCEEHGCELPDDVIVAHGRAGARRARVGLTGRSARASRWSSTSGRATAPRAAGRT